MGAVLNIALNAICIPMFGFIAAGYTTLVCYIIYAIAHYCFMRRVLKQYMNGEKIYNIWIIIGIGTALVCCATLFMTFYKYWIIRYSLVLLGVVVLFLKRRSIIRLFSQMRSKQVN